MPIYDFKCGFCQHVESDVYERMSTVSIVCPRCNDSMVRIPVRVHSDLKEFHTPIEMYSVAVEDINEVRSLKDKCPDADISDDPRDPMYGVPIARSRKAKLQVLKASGFQETNSERVRS